MNSCRLMLAAHWLKLNGFYTWWGTAIETYRICIQLLILLGGLVITKKKKHQYKVEIAINMQI